MRQVQIVGRLIVPALLIAVLACGPSASPEAEVAEAEPVTESTAPNRRGRVRITRRKDAG